MLGNDLHLAVLLGGYKACAVKRKRIIRSEIKVRPAFNQKLVFEFAAVNHSVVSSEPKMHTV